MNNNINQVNQINQFLSFLSNPINASAGNDNIFNDNLTTSTISAHNAINNIVAENNVNMNGCSQPQNNNNNKSIVSNNMNNTNLPNAQNRRKNAQNTIATSNNTKLQLQKLNQSIHYDSNKASRQLVTTNNNNSIPKNILPSFPNHVQNTITNSNTKNKIIHTNSHTIYSVQSDAPS
eukprot:84728_1